MRKYIIFLFLFYSANLFSQKFETKQGGHCFSMEIPDYLAKTFSLNDVATLQYQNVTKEAYVIVIEDNKEQLEGLGVKFIGAKDFLINFLKDFKNESLNRKESPITEFESNGNKHAQVELTWTEDSVEFYMLITTVESEAHFYKVMCWTIQANKGLLKNDFLRISKTLKD